MCLTVLQHMAESDWSNFMRRCDVFNELGNSINFLWLHHCTFCWSDLQKARYVNYIKTFHEKNAGYCQLKLSYKTMDPHNSL